MVLDSPAMATKTPHRSRGRRSSAAAATAMAMEAPIPANPASTITPAWARLPRSRLLSRPTRQLQGTAMLMINLLINFFSAAVIQPHTPMK